MRKMVLAAAATLALGVATAGLAQPGSGHWHGGGDLFRVIHGLSLGDDQKEQIHQIMEQGRTASEPTVTQLRAVRQRIEAELVSGDTDAATKAQALVAQVEPLEAQLHAAMLNTALQVRGVLTSDQLAQASAALTKLQSLHEQERQAVPGPQE